MLLPAKWNRIRLLFSVRQKMSFATSFGLCHSISISNLYYYLFFLRSWRISAFANPLFFSSAKYLNIPCSILKVDGFGAIRQAFAIIWSAIQQAFLQFDFAFLYFLYCKTMKIISFVVVVVVFIDKTVRNRIMESFSWKLSGLVLLGIFMFFGYFF